jgi:hypothetical protein
MDLELEHPGVKNSMIKALGNVAPRHLLDTRLNPPAGLRARVKPTAPLTAEIASLAFTRDSPERSRRVQIAESR